MKDRQKERERKREREREREKQKKVNLSTSLGGDSTPGPPVSETIFNYFRDFEITRPIDVGVEAYGRYDGVLCVCVCVLSRLLRAVLKWYLF